MESEKEMKEAIKDIIEKQDALDAAKEAHKDAIHDVIFRYLKALDVNHRYVGFPYRSASSFDIEEWTIDPIGETIDVHVIVDETEHYIPLKYLYDKDALDAFVKEQEDERAERDRKIEKHLEQVERTTLKTLQEKYEKVNGHG